jgi:molecular chaperone GrpE
MTQEENTKNNAVQNDNDKKSTHSGLSAAKKIIEQKIKNKAQSNINHQNIEKNDEQKQKKLEEEVQKLKKSLMYAVAEKENIKKAAAKELEDSKNFSISTLAKDMLVSIENMEKAIEYADRKKIEEDKAFKSFFEGVNLTLSSVFETLKRHGVQKVEAQGKKFDHNLHQAIKTIKKDDTQSGMIADVLQDGYIIKGRLLRPAIVVVVDND